MEPDCTAARKDMPLCIIRELNRGLPVLRLPGRKSMEGAAGTVQMDGLPLDCRETMTWKNPTRIT